MMELFFLFGLGFCGSIIWFLPTSATTVYYGYELGWNPLLVGLVAASAQTLGYLVLYHCGHFLLDRWNALDRRVQSTREQYLQRLERGYLPWTLVGGVLGMPPMVALATLASAFEARLAAFLCLAFLGRWIRFAFMATAGLSVSAAVRALWS